MGISNVIANMFRKRGELEPKDLIKEIEREVVKSKTKSDGIYIVPNDYTVCLFEEDCHRLSAARVIKALHEAVEKKVIRENLFMDGHLAVRMEKMFEGDEFIKVQSKFIDDVKITEDTINLDNDVLSHTLIEDDDTYTDRTIVADKTKITSSMKFSEPRKIEYNLAVITDSENTELVLGERQIYIGRKETNDFILNDEGASRVHAYISYERHRHVLHDAGSLNGTYVNAKLTDRRDLRDGDKILIGNTELIYKVL